MEKGLRYILYALLLTPMFFLSIFLFPFITTKVLYFRLLVEAAFFIYLILAFKDPGLRPRWNWITISVWVYLAVVMLTSLLGVNFNKSFWSTVERGEGIITLLHFAVYFMMLTAVFRSQKDWFNYLLAAVSVTAFNALYGVAQLLNLSFVIHGGASRISGTIGNAAFFAAYMLFGIFLSIYLLAVSKGTASLKLRFYLWAVLILELFVLYHTQTRGAIVALAAAILIYALFQMFQGRSGAVKLASAAGIVLIIFAGLSLYLGRNSEFVRSRSTLNRLATISTKDITTQSRFDTWEASLKGWKDRFVIGYGYENYNIAFNKYFPARIYKDQGSQIWFDRAHNIFFDVAVTSGILGLVSYLAIFVSSGVYVFRMRALYPGSRVLGLALLAYLIQNIFVFDTHATYLMFFLVLAHLSFLVNTETEPRHEPHPAKIHKTSYGLQIFAAVLLFLIAYFVNLEAAFANLYATDGIKSSKLKQYREVKSYFEKSLSYGTYMDEEIRQRAVDYLGEATGSGQLSPQEQREFYQFVVLELRKSIEESPKDVKNYLFLMNVLNRFPFDQRSLDEVLILGEKALALSPTRPHLYWELGQAYFSKQDQEKGLEQFRAAIELNHEPKESHLNYLLAGAVASREDIVQQEFEFIKANYEFTGQEYLAIGRAYSRGGNDRQAIEFIRRAADLDPRNPDTRAKLAAAYGEICDLDNARLEVLEAINLEPSFQQEGEAFLRQLAEKCKK